MVDQIRRAKVLATLGPASDQAGVFEALIAAGVNVVRLNFSHGAAERHAQRISEVRSAAKWLGREVGVLGDLQGPKVCIETFVDGKVALQAGKPFTLDCSGGAPPGDATRVGCSHHGLVHDMHAGDTLLLDDGLVALVVERIDGDQIHCVSQTDGVLSNRKGLNRLGGGLSLGALTDKDRNDIKLAANLGGDFLFQLGLPSVGDRVIITSGDHTEQHGSTNTLRPLKVGELGLAECLGEL
jgi:pyruvate kinase